MSIPSILSTLTPDGRTIRQEWEAAVKECCTRAITRYPDETKRILTGFGIVMEDGVSCVGTQYTVQSQTQEGMQYPVNGSCPCPDAQHRAPEGRCKHRWAKALYVHATKHLNETPQVASPRYYATYYPDDQRQMSVQGIAEYREYGWVFFPGDGTCSLPATLARLVLGGRIDLCEAQRAIDGESLGFKFGQPQLPSYRAKDDNEYLRSEDPETVPYAKLVPEPVCVSCARPASTPGLVLNEWHDSIVCTDCLWHYAT